MASQIFFDHRMYTGLVLWLRVAYAGLARCGANLHAEFAPGELRTMMGTDSSQLSKAIARAKAEGLLHKQSNVYCLQLSPEFFGSNLPGSNKPCPTCTGRISRPRRIPEKSLPVESPDKSSRKREQIRWSARRPLSINDHGVVE